MYRFMEDFRLERLAEAVAKDLGSDPELWFEPGGYESVALAILNAIYSTGNKFSGVLNALNNYRAEREGDGFEPDQDSAADLIAAVASWGGTQGLVARTNKWKTSTAPGAPHKAEAALGAARILDSHNLGTVPRVRKRLADPDAQANEPAKREWLGLPGQRSGLTWTYFLMLCGVPGVKADRMVIRYVNGALDEKIGSREAAELVSRVADRLDVTHNKLDHAIWRKESGRPYLLEEAPAAI